MLTKRQLWRRSSSSKRSTILDVIDETQKSKATPLFSEMPEKYLSEPSLVTLHQAQPLHKNPEWTNGNLQAHLAPIHENNNNNNNHTHRHSILKKSPTKHNGSKNVRWNVGVRVILIPTRMEYEEAGVANAIWWNDLDFSDFRTKAAEEVQLLMRQTHVTLKEAIKILYQPELNWKYEQATSSSSSKTIPSKAQHPGVLQLQLEEKTALTSSSSSVQGFRDDSMRAHKKKLTTGVWQEDSDVQGDSHGNGIPINNNNNNNNDNSVSVSGLMKADYSSSLTRYAQDLAIPESIYLHLPVKAIARSLTSSGMIHDKQLLLLHRSFPSSVATPLPTTKSTAAPQPIVSSVFPVKHSNHHSQQQQQQQHQHQPRKSSPLLNELEDSPLWSYTESQSQQQQKQQQRKEEKEEEMHQEQFELENERRVAYVCVE